MNLRLAKKNRERSFASWTLLYEKTVEKKIRAKYSVSAELAILRQQVEKPEEFAAYHDYAERCKTEAKNELGMEETEGKEVAE